MDKKIVLRDIFPSISSHLEHEEITVITGPRQVGKTTLVRQLMDHLSHNIGVSVDLLHYFNLDIASDQKLFIHQEDTIQFIKNRIPRSGKLYLFIDEVQRLVNPGIFLKGIYDLYLPVKLVVTGSSSLEIRAKTAEPLTGRKRLFFLHPLSFREYMSFWNASLYKLALQGDLFAQEKIKTYLEQYLLYGGYPKVALESVISERLALLHEIYTGYMDKDIIGFFRVKDNYAFMRCVELFAFEIGNLINMKTTSEEIHIKRETLVRYLIALEQTFTVARIRPYAQAIRTEIRKMPKLYFLDTGLRNLTLGEDTVGLSTYQQRNDKGRLLENFVYDEMVKCGTTDINFWRTKDGAEVDFVVRRGGNTIPIEVKSTTFTKQEIPRGLSSFIKLYKPKTAIIISFSHLPPISLHTTTIHYLLPYELPDFFDVV